MWGMCEETIELAECGLSLVPNVAILVSAV